MQETFRMATKETDKYNVIKQAISGKIKQFYNGFGPTLLMEKLDEREGVQISVSALRRIMIEEELWKAKRPKPRHRKNRVRRSRVGELIQIDASPHAWFEDRGEECNLVHFIDDASSDIFLSRFVKSEDRVMHNFNSTPTSRVNAPSRRVKIVENS